MAAKNIGVNVKPPEKECNDNKCPFHGNLKVRGQIIEGKVATAKMQHSIIVQRQTARKNSKYERWEKRIHKYTTYCPPCIDVKAGDMVKIMECRPLSKMCAWVVIEKMEGIR